MELKDKVEEFESKIVEKPEEMLGEVTDKYFTWSKKALENGGENPEVKKVIHAGLQPEENIAGLEETAELYSAVTGDEVDLYIADNAEGRQPLMIAEGPAGKLFEPETPALGTLSYHLTEANEGYQHVNPETYGEGVAAARELIDEFEDTVEKHYGEEIEVPLIDFGARHYHPAQQEELAEAAFENGAAGHSTEKGVGAINQMLENEGREDEKIEAGGTMNHAFVLSHAEQGLENATLDAFKSYESFFNQGVDSAEDENYSAVPVLIDTNNAEIDDTLEVCEYMEDEYGEDFEIVVRIDTNGANHAQSIPNEEINDDNVGVSPDAVSYFAEEMVKSGYRDNITLAISSGMGKTEKLEEVLDRAESFYEENNELMFDAIGAGSFDGCNNLYTTSDIVEVNEKPRGKKGRLEELQDAARKGLDTEVADEEVFDRYIDENMVKYQRVANAV